MHCRWLALVILIPVGCNKAKPEQQSAASAGGVIAVKVTSPTKQSLEWSIEQPATVMPYEITPVAVRLSGFVASIAKDGAGKPIDIGSIVKAEQVLAKLEVPELAPQLAEKKAAEAQARAELAAAQEGLKVLDALGDVAKAKADEAEAGVARAQADVERWTTQLEYEEGLLSRGQIDAQSRDVSRKQLAAVTAAKSEAEARVASAKASVAECEARRKRGDADVKAAQARVDVAAAQVKAVEADVAYTEIKAPFAGIVTARTVHPGHYVQPGTAVFTVARVDRLRVAVDVPEVAIANAATGVDAVVRIPALGNREFTEKVARTTGVVEPGTRALRAELEIDNADRMLRPGMYAYVTIRTESPDALVLPATCVLAADETHYVYLVEDGKAVKYRVRVGRMESGNIQVLDRRRATATAGTPEPFTGSEKVVNGNLGALADGVAVTIKE